MTDSIFSWALLFRLKTRQLLIGLGICKPTLQDALDRIILSKELEE